MFVTEDQLKSALPDLTSAMLMDALQADVTVHRDPWGIPHIQAENENDLFVAQGFVTAQDRLWHMDYDRHRALGRWAEWVGESGVDQDRLMRAAGMGRTAKLDYEACSQSARAMVDAYTTGVNAFIQSTDSFPIEYTLLECEPEPWENWHCLTVYKMRNTLLGTFEPKLLRTRLTGHLDAAPALARLLNGYPDGHLVTVPPGEEYAGARLEGLDALSRSLEEIDRLKEVEAGSNAWSISGDRTVSGKPLVAGDSHRALDTPSVYYQVHLSCPDFTVIGHSVPGMPGALHFCHNEYVAWGMTYGSADTQDLFLERFRDDRDQRRYAFEDGWREAQVLNERLEVRNGDPVDVEVTITHHGPVVAGDPARGTGVAISDPGLIEGTPWVDAARDAMASRSVEELHSAFSNWNDRVNNYAVADVEGTFGYLHEGRIPVRDEANGWRAVPGWDGRHEWQGYIPQEELPRSLDPEIGYVITCNQRVAPSDYPYYVGVSFTPEFRARRIQRRLERIPNGSATVEEMGAIHGERQSTPARALVERLIEVDVEDVRLQKALSYLRSWDCRMDRDHVAPTIYSETRSQLIERLVRHLFGGEGDRMLSGEAGADTHVRLVALEITLGLQREDDRLLPEGETWESVLLRALEQALERLQASLGEDIDGWFWGRVHRTRPSHPLSKTFPDAAAALDPPSLGVHGDGDTPLAASYSLPERYTVSGLSVNRYIHDPSDWRNSRWIVPLGSSGHPASPHFADQAELWADVEFIPQLWDWEEIREKADTTQRLSPVNGLGGRDGHSRTRTRNESTDG